MDISTDSRALANLSRGNREVTPAHTYPSIHPSIHPSIRSSICPSVHPSAVPPSLPPSLPPSSFVRASCGRAHDQGGTHSAAGVSQPQADHTHMYTNPHTHPLLPTTVRMHENGSRCSHFVWVLFSTADLHRTPQTPTAHRNQISHLTYPSQQPRAIASLPAHGGTVLLEQLSSREFHTPKPAPVQGGAAPLELLSVKPCDRCKVTTIDAESLVSGREPLAMLGTFRSGRALGWAAKERSWTHAVFFGWNMVAQPPPGAVLAVGDAVEVTARR
eukprot:363162-Chlamydomonas_euryale.AAC.5